MFHVGEIIWGHVRGHPWWPGRVVSPTVDQLKHYSINRIPPEQRLVWFFNDNDNYTLLSIKNLRPFCDERITSQTKSKKGKVATRLNAAFEQASAALRRPNDLDDEDPIDAIVVTPPSVINARSSANEMRKPSKTKASNLPSSPHEEELPPKQLKFHKRRHQLISTDGVSQTRPKSSGQAMSQKRTQSMGRTTGDAESDRLSTHCNPSPCDRSSQETGIDSDPNAAVAKSTPPRRILVRLRIREKLTDEVSLNDEIHPDSTSSKPRTIEQTARTSSSGGRLKKDRRGSGEARAVKNESEKQRSCESSDEDDKNPRGDGKDRSRTGVKRKFSSLPPKRRHKSQHNGEDVTKRRRLTVTKKVPEYRKPRSSDVRLPVPDKDNIDVPSESEDATVAHAIRPSLEPKPSTEVTRITEIETARLSDVPVRRSRRMRRVSSRMAGTEEGSAEESDDDARGPVASKRSRGTEAPRMSDGQRRLHIRREGTEKPNSDVGSEETKENSFPHVMEALDEEMVPNGELDEENKFYKDLSKLECIKMIAKLHETLRRKNVQLWLRGRKLVEAREVLRTEEGVIKACEAGVEKAEKLLKWAKKHEGYEKGDGSRFAKMEAKVVEECEVLADVYFDRRRVSLRKIGPRILKLTKELTPYSQRVTEMLLEVLVLWVDLTADSRKKEARIKSRS